MKEADFSGYASKNDLLCADGRTIRAGAFAHQDGKQVPLLWQHMHNSPANVLGHAILHNRADGVYTEAFFNETPAAQNAKLLVLHGDVNGLSIYATKLIQKGSNVVGGIIQEVSLVLSRANPGAIIENVSLAHGDTEEILDDEAIIYTDEILAHGGLLAIDNAGATKIETGDDLNMSQQTLEHADDKKTVDDVIATMDEEQKNVMNFVVESAVQEALKDAAGDDTIQHSAITADDLVTRITEGLAMHQYENVFEKNGGGKSNGPTLTHDQLNIIVSDANRLGSLKESFLAHAAEFGIEDIDYLFPDAKTLSNTPDFLSRRMEWVKNVLGNTKHSPFSRIKSIVADITADEARAKGYVKGNLKKEEIIKLLKRVTTPKTVYKKQKLDRDDIVDITDIDVVSWLKSEMRLMLDEEVAISILIGDGREPDDEDKIDEDHVRPIAYDNDMYNHVVTLDGTPEPSETIEAIIRARKFYKGTGTPSFYTTDDALTDLLLDKDTLGRRFYNTEAELAAALRVKEIVVVEAMERDASIVGIMVNLVDYTIGADKGGEINMFDDFDIDYNQQKYLIETRISGALTKPKSAITIKKNPGTVVTPTSPSFVTSTGVVTIPSVTGVVYKNAETGATLTAGAQSAIASGASIEIEAVPASASYSFPHGFDADWVFTRS